MKYIVNISNIGNVQCPNKKEAQKTYSEYVSQSKMNYGRAAGEDVALIDNKGNILNEYFGTLNHQEED